MSERDRLPRNMDKRPQKGLWAPGQYVCTCSGCSKQFWGAKLAKHCADCAYGVDNRTLEDIIAKAIAAIPANNPGYISARQETLGDLVNHEIIRKIAQVAVAEGQRVQVTGEEHAVLTLVGQAYAAFMELPEMHPADLPELVTHVHAIQNIVLARVAMRMMKKKT